MGTLLFRNVKYIITPTSTNDLKILEDKDVLVENGVISCISDRCSYPGSTNVIYADKHILLPAFIDTHTHVEAILLHGLMPDYSYEVFYSKLYEILNGLDRDAIYRSSRYGCLRMIMSGVIGFIDSSRNYNEVINACSNLGLYIYTGPINPEISIVNDYIKRVEENKYVKPLVNIHQLYTLSDEYLEELHRITEENNILINYHLSEIRREVYLVKKTKNMFPVEYLYRNGLLDNKTILSHMNWITSTEIEYVAEKNASITVLPHTTTRLAEEGFTPVYEILEKNIRLSIGSDGVVSDTLNLLDELRELILLYRNNYWDTRLATRYVFPRILLNMYRITGINGGVIEVNQPANLVLLRINDLKHRPLTRSNLLSRLLLTGGFEVEAVVSNGKTLYWEHNREKFINELIKLSNWAEEELLPKIDLYNGVVIG